MVSGKAFSVHFTANLEANLQAIEAYWTEAGFPTGYDRLLDEIGESVIPNLESFPTIGRLFASRTANSVEALSRQDALRQQLARLGQGGELREYLLADYLLLYVVTGETIYLLSIKHHKQLSFDLEQHWT